MTENTVKLEVVINLPYREVLAMKDDLLNHFPRIDTLEDMDNGVYHLKQHPIKLNMTNMSFTPCFAVEIVELDGALHWLPHPMQGECNMCLHGKGEHTEGDKTLLTITSELKGEFPAIYGLMVPAAHKKIIRDMINKFVASVEAA